MAKVDIIGTIGVDVTAQAVRDALAIADDSIELYIDSPGGDVVESNAISLALAEYTLQHPEKTYTCICGALVASAAANVLAKLPLAYTIKAYRDTLIMYHSCTGIVEGNPQQLKDFGLLMGLVNESIINALLMKTTLPADEVKAAFDSGRELWLDGTKAQAVGLVDDLIDAQPDIHDFSRTASAVKVLALVAQYKETHMDEDIKKVEEIEVKPEEVKPEEIEKQEIVEEVKEELEEKPEVDFEAECEKLKAENDGLKKELEALKALVAKYQPTAKPAQAKSIKADWLGMVRELNARHLSEAEYAREYGKLKAEHKDAFNAFMKSRTIR